MSSRIPAFGRANLRAGVEGFDAVEGLDAVMRE